MQSKLEEMEEANKAEKQQELGQESSSKQSAYEALAFRKESKDQEFEQAAREAIAAASRAVAARAAAQTPIVGGTPLRQVPS